MIFWLTTTYRRCDFTRLITKNHWHCIDAHFHDGARRVLQSVLPIKAGKNTFMTEYNLSEVWFSRMQNQKSLTLPWRSFCPGCIHNMQSINLAKSIIHIVLAVFLIFSSTFFLITMLCFNNTCTYIIIISQIPCLSVTAHHQLQDCSIWWFCL